MDANEPVEPEINYPAWTEYQEKNGLDPLGMQNSSVNLYQTFLPGISNVSLRMRYYGLYVWLCRTYAQADGSSDPEQWKRFVRRAEALYALVASHNGGETGVAGIQWAEKALNNTASDTVDFASSADPGSETMYLQQAWGAYGAAYGSQLYAIGIFWESPDHALPVPSKSTGDRLSRFFADSLGDLAPLFAEIIERGEVTRKELDILAPMAPSEIGLTGDERALYQEILLTPIDAEDVNALSRRLSILLVLNVAALLSREPTSEEVRWILYSGQDQRGHDLKLGSAELEAQRQRWWVYHANDLCHIALETLLKFALDTLSVYPNGIRLERLIPRCIDRILEEVDDVPESWSGFRERTKSVENSFSDDEDTSEWSLCQKVLKGAGRSDKVDCAPEIALNAIMLLATLHNRIDDEEHPVTEELSRFNSGAFQTLLSETNFLSQNEKEPLRDTLSRLFEQRIVRRHLWVAARKFQHGDYTFLIEADEGRLRVREKDGPVFTNPRLGPTITFLRDIHLIGGQGLTDYGAGVVAEV
jgi:hypothetical protein